MQVDHNGVSIYYRVSGNGRPVMLVHGFGETGEVWNGQVAYLKSKYRLIVPDLPGSGRSALTGDMSMDGLAEALLAVLKNEGLDDSYTIIGHSMGGYVMLAFAERLAPQMRAFGLFHSTAFSDSEEKKATRRKGIEFIRENGPFEFLKTSTPNLFSPMTKSENPALIEDFISSLNNFTGEALVSYYESMIKRPDRTDVLKNTKCPVLFVMGEHDAAVPMADGLKQCHLPGKSYIHVLHQSGHMGMLEEVKKTNSLLEAFLDTT